MGAEEISPRTHPPVQKSGLLLLQRDPQEDPAREEFLSELEEYAQAEESLCESLECRDERYSECIFQAKALASAARREIHRLGRPNHAPE